MKPFLDPFPFRNPETRSSIGEVIAEITKADLKAAEAQDLKELPGAAGEAAHNKLHKTIGKFVKAKPVSEAVVQEESEKPFKSVMAAHRERLIARNRTPEYQKKHNNRLSGKAPVQTSHTPTQKGEAKRYDIQIGEAVMNKKKWKSVVSNWKKPQDSTSARLDAGAEKRGGGAAQDKAADSVQVRLGKQKNKKPVTEAHDNLSGYYDGARGGGGSPAKRSKTNSPKGNSTFGVPSYKSSDFSAMSKKTADVLVKELERIAKYLDDQYNMAPTARTSIKELVEALKSKS